MNKYHDGYGLIWDGKFTKNIKKIYKISFCTTVMNRLYNLKETLLKNIEDNKEYPDLEFVILDYNSQDGLEKWMKDNMMEHIESGRVSYYRTEEPKYFNMAHSRNIAFKVDSSIDRIIVLSFSGSILLLYSKVSVIGYASN